MSQYYGRSLLLVVLVAFPWLIGDPYYQHLVILFLLWVAIGSGWNLISGYTGQVLFGAGAFFGLGAYAAALLMHKLEISAWWGLALGPVLSALLAFPFGWICFRLRGPYFALATLALNEIMRYIATIWESLTEGMVGILLMQTFISKLPYYYIALAIATGAIVTIEILMRSRLGYYFVSIREDQEAAESMGISSVYYKMVSLTIAAAIMGLAGALYTNYMGFIDPRVVFALFDISIMAVLVVLVGGVATVYGPVVGAFIMVALSELFRSGGFGTLASLSKATGWPFMLTVTKYVSEAHILSFGILVVLVIRYLPNGVMGEPEKLKRALLFWKRQAS